MTAVTMDQGAVAFPEYRKELVKMASEDQAEIRMNMHRISQIKSESAKHNELEKLFHNCHMRANRMMEIIADIPQVSISTIGSDGCEAVLLITQHSYLEIMKKILSIVEKQLEQDPGSFPIVHIPALRDRIMVLQERRQRYGTQWRVDKNNIPFLIPVQNFANANRQRAKYGLSPIQKPVNLAIGAEKYPLGKGPATAADQKPLTDEEYELVARYSLSSLA